MKKMIKSATVFRFNNLIAGPGEEKADPKGYKYSHSTYTKDGQLLTEIRYNEDGEVEEKYENKYDPAGKLIEEMTYLDDDEIAEHKTYERDGEGHVIRAFKHYQDGDKDTIHYHRDEQGRLTEKITIDSFNEEEAREIIEYEADRVARRRVYEYDELMLDESYTYNDKGIMTGHTKWSAEDEDSKFVNEFDDKGNMATALKYDLKGKLLAKVVYTYEGEHLASITEENPYGTNTTTLLYDERGNPTEQIELNQNGEINNKAVRKFNENDDLAEAEIFINYHGQGVNRHYTLKYTYEHHD